jgi:hypothetical protein
MIRTWNKNPDMTDLINTLETGLPVNFLLQNLDAFGRLRVSEIQTLMDITHTTGLNPLLECQDSSNAYSVWNSSSSVVDLDLSGTSSNSYIIRQSRKYSIYQPGKSLLVLASGVLSTISGAQTINRIGYFDSSNGYFFEYNNGSINIVERSISSGSFIETRIAQGNWNINNPSYYDYTKANIYFIDFSWLGVGVVRCGVIHNGVYINFHDFYHDNIVTTTYTTTANLPVRYEIRGNGSIGKLRQICCTVQSEGGYSLIGIPYSASRGTSSVTVGTSTELPLLSIKLSSSKCRTSVIPSSFTLFSTSSTANIIYYIRLFRSPASNPLTNSSFVSPDENSAVLYDISATAINTSNSHIITTDYFAGSKTTTSINNVADIFQNYLTLTSDVMGNSDYLVISGKSLSGNVVMYASLDWQELY